MKRLIIIGILIIPFLTNAQSRIDSLFEIGDRHFENKDYLAAKKVYESLREEIPKGTNDYKYATDQIAMIYFFGRENHRNASKYEKSIEYLLEFISYIEKEKEFLRPLWNNEKKYFLIKTVIQNYFSLNEIKKAKKYQRILYKAYEEKILPEGIDQHYSFEMFRWKDKNIWGYEYYPELGAPQTEGSFSKIVYYVYSTDESGNDKEQLYRLHVLKVHKIDEKQPDYVLTKRIAEAKGEKGGTFWTYTYNSPIDYEKLKKDITELLKKDD